MDDKGAVFHERKKPPAGEERYVAYVFCGLLSLVGYSYFLNGTLSLSVGSIGEILPGAAVVGIFMYAVYRRIIGELFFYPMTIHLTDVFWRCTKKSPSKCSPLSYFREKLSKKVSALDLENIFGIGRAYLIQNEITHFWDHGRVELHVLYLSAIFGAGFAVLAAYNHDCTFAIGLALFSLLIWMFSTVADSMQCQREFYLMRLHEKEILALVKLQMFGCYDQSEGSLVREPSTTSGPMPRGNEKEEHEDDNN